MTNWLSILVSDVQICVAYIKSVWAGGEWNFLVARTLIEFHDPCVRLLRLRLFRLKYNKILLKSARYEY